jgi:putative ABC transport system permease protein
MLRNYLLTAYKVFMRRKLFTAINLGCIVLTLVVLMVITALLDTAFWPSGGVEAKSDRMLQIYGIRSERFNKMGQPAGMRISLLGHKTIARYFKPMTGVERVSAITRTNEVSVYQGDRVSRAALRRVDADYWKIMNFRLRTGRLPDEEDSRLGRMVAVVNATTARRLFPDRAAVGERISVEGQTFDIIGVVDDVNHLNAFADIWAPLETFPSTNYRNEVTGNFAVLLLARSPADLPRIRAEVERIAKNIEPVDDQIFGKTTIWADSKLDVFARGLLERQGDADSGAGRLLAGIAGGMVLFMLLPALNLVNLNMGRIMERSTEIGVRKAFGATSLQLAGQLVVENVLLCLAGALVGLACAQAALWWLEAARLSPYLDVHVNLKVFGWGMLIAFVFGLLSGAIPAWRMSRLDPVHALKGAA